MRSLHLNASETVALLNNLPAEHHAALPLKMRHVLPARLSPPWSYVMCGNHVQARRGGCIVHERIHVPLQAGQDVTVTTPETPDGVPVYRALREALLERPGEPFAWPRRTRRTPRERAPLTVPVTGVTVRRTTALTAGDALLCGARRTRDGWVLGDARLPSATPLLALADDWDASRPPFLWQEQPWALGVGPHAG